METERSDFDAILPGEISSAAVRTGNEWMIPLPQAKEAISLATKRGIAVLGVEIFRVSNAGLITEGYSGYEFKLGDDWVKFEGRGRYHRQICFFEQRSCFAVRRRT